MIVPVAEWARPRTARNQRTERSGEAEERWLLAFGGAMASILALLAFVGVRRQAVIAPRFAEMARSAALYHRYLPALAAIPILPFVVLAWSAVAALWLVYLCLLWRLRHAQLKPRPVAAGAVALALLTQLVPPLFTTDIFSYAMFGRLAGVYDRNPYLTSATRAAPADPLTPYLYWHDISSPYGPIWTLISWCTAHGAGTTPFELVVRFKLVALLAVLLDGWLIYRLVHRRWPEHAGFSYLAFAWNPLVLVEGSLLGHNDVVILALLLGGAMLLRARPVLGVVGITASALIKYSTTPLLGLSMLRVAAHTPARRRLTLLAASALAILTVTVVAFSPFWAGPAGLVSTLAEPGRGINNPVIGVAGWALTRLSGGRLPLDRAPGAVVLGAALFGLWQLFDIWHHLHRAPAEHDELSAWCRSATMFLVFWPRIHTWYFLLPLGLAIAAGPPHRRLFWQVLAVSILSYVSYFH